MKLSDPALARLATAKQLLLDPFQLDESQAESPPPGRLAGIRIVLKGAAPSAAYQHERFPVVSSQATLWL